MQMRRGDTKKFKFQRKTKNKEVITTKPEKMYITFKNNTKEKTFLFQKTFDNGITYDEDTNYYHVVIKPEDTDKLFYKNYCYDIEIINNGEPKTIKVDNLEILEEVTFACNEV